MTALDVGAERLRAVGRTERAGVARVIVNDVPRWRARVNGEPVPIARAEDGYMQVPVPAGEVTIALDYITAPVGWLARSLLTLGLLLLLGLAAPRGRRRAGTPGHAGATAGVLLPRRGRHTRRLRALHRAGAGDGACPANTPGGCRES